MISTLRRQFPAFKRWWMEGHNRAYAYYLFWHKWYVGVECWKRGLYWQAIVHDWVKFLPWEWRPYANYFYGKRDEMAFNYAWNHHQKCQKHHWQYYVLMDDNGLIIPLDIPEPYFTEMICDWIGAGKAIKKVRNEPWNEADTRNWFIKNTNNMRLSWNTTDRIERLLGVYGDV